MKKKDIISLIRYYAEKNDIGFRQEAQKIAEYFDKTGDSQLAQYITMLLSGHNVWTPQADNFQSSYLEPITTDIEPLFLPDAITNDLIGIINAVSKNMGIHKFIFQGPPGTGKTEAVKQLANKLSKELYKVNFSQIIDSKLGQTQKNLSALFTELNKAPQPDQLLILLDEIDALSLDRTNPNDVREMGRVTSEFLTLLDQLNTQIIIIATTNLINYFDKALLRRFDAIINFDCYTQTDLVEIAEYIISYYLKKQPSLKYDSRLFKKILKISTLPAPAEIKNIIKKSIAFSNPDDTTDYLKRLYLSFTLSDKIDITQLKEEGFTLREIETLTHIPKSSVAIKLKEKD